MLHKTSALLKYAISVVILVIAAPSLAQVQIHFHSFNGSVLAGRYPHTFISLSGTLEETGEPIDENYGFSAQKITPAVLNGPVKHKIVIEPKKYLTSTNIHFSIRISDAQYRKIISEVKSWETAPGTFYNLKSRNCIHFVGAIAKLVGLQVEFPKEMLRQPKRWLNHIALLNPKFGGRVIK